MTLRHVVMWKLGGETVEERDSQAAEAIAMLEALKDEISEIRAISAYRNELFEGTNYDLTLIADFDDAEGLAIYAAHPKHLPVIELMKEIMVARVATDFTV